MVSVNRFPAGDINGRGVPGIYGTKALRAERARSQPLSLYIAKPVNTKDKLGGGCACVRGCLGGAARVLSAGVLRSGVNLGHICTAHPRILEALVRQWRSKESSG
ncbi:hypothetical protein EAG_00925 [Camponotus floridanus]|uniref:Uncharacterized protein n=1 Tax=Camponotus floridanus TaxID=104421 RepID=E2AN74_CAMFO|nr:hypothetical protein EAG_00925 [Camponotus floridanus]